MKNYCIFSSFFFPYEPALTHYVSVIIVVTKINF